MLEMNSIGWIVVGFIAGAISGALRRRHDRRGCLPNIVVGILGGVARRLAGDADGLHRRPGLHRRGRRRGLRLARRPPRPQRDRSDVHGPRPASAGLTIGPMTDHRPMRSRRPPRPRPGTARRAPYSPGLEGVVAGETSLSLVDGERGRLLYRGYRIGDLVDARHVPGRSRTCCGPATGTRGTDSPTAPGPARGADRPARAARRRPSRWTRCGPRSRPGARPRTRPGRRPSSRPGR